MYVRKIKFQEGVKNSEDIYMAIDLYYHISLQND